MENHLPMLAGWGMAIFMVSSVGCGFANSFWTLLACRIVMGAGEASIINLTGRQLLNASA